MKDAINQVFNEFYFAPFADGQLNNTIIHDVNSIDIHLTSLRLKNTIPFTISID